MVQASLLNFRGVEPLEDVPQEGDKKLVTRLVGEEVRRRNCDYGHVVKSITNLCPQLSTSFTSEMSPLEVWPSSTNVECRFFSSHHDHGTKVAREDSPQTSGSSFEFLALATEEGLKLNAIAPQLELVPRSPEFVDVVVNCVHKPVRITGLP